jgi:hypothetical protein
MAFSMFLFGLTTPTLPDTCGSLPLERTMQMLD